MPSEAIPERRRRSIFLALVTAQDQGEPVPESRALVAEVYGVTEAQVREIEQEGLREQWPPL